MRREGNTFINMERKKNRWTRSVLLGYIFLLSFPVHPIRADSFVLSNNNPSPCTTTTTALFASQLIIPPVGVSSYSSPEHFFLVFCILCGFLPRFFFSGLVEVLLRWRFGIYQYYVYIGIVEIYTKRMNCFA